MKKSAFVKLFAFSFSLFFVVIFTLFTIHPAFAQAKTAQRNNYTVTNTNPDVPNNLHNWTQNVMIEVMSALTCQLAGVDPINPKQGCLGIDSASGKIGFVQKAGLPAGASAQAGGAIGFMGNMIATLYTPPLHASDYFKDLASNFGINKKAYAQATGGTGFQGLTPLIGIWSAFRNIVYLFLVIIFVVIGLAIMFRVKIDPRTVMTIQNQIPKIIIGILVVTFSFAIAGFLIDLMWVFIYLIYGIFSGIPGVDIQSLNPSSIQGQTAIEVASHIKTGGIAGISLDVALNGSDILKEILGIAPTNAELNPFSGDIKNPLDFFGWLSSIGSIFGFGVNLNPFNWLINAISAGASLFVGFKLLGLPEPTVLGNSFGWITNLPAALPAMIGVYAGANVLIREALPILIIFLILSIAILFALFRLWFTLIMAYVHILIDVVLAPFWIIGGIVPGSPISLSGWLRDLIANLAAFPAVIGMFMLGKVFMDAFGKTPATGANFVPPLIGNPGDPSLIGSLIGLGIILMTPNVVNMLKTALKAPKIDTGGVGKAIGVGGGVLTSPAKPVVQGFSFLAGQRAAQKLPFIGGWLGGGQHRP